MSKAKAGDSVQMRREPHPTGRRHEPPNLAEGEIGGEGGIRTHVPLTGQDAFEAPPLRPLRYLSGSCVMSGCRFRTARFSEPAKPDTSIPRVRRVLRTFDYTAPGLPGSRSAVRVHGLLEPRLMRSHGIPRERDDRAGRGVRFRDAGRITSSRSFDPSGNASSRVASATP